MNDTIARVQAERKLIREEHLGPHSLSTTGAAFISSMLGIREPVSGIGSGAPYRVDERGRVHFPRPVRALIRDGYQWKAVDPHIPEEGEVFTITGNAFTPLITEKDWPLRQVFLDYMRELVADSGWRGRPLPRGGFPMPRLSELDEVEWGSAIDSARALPEGGDADRWRKQDSIV